MKHSQVLEVILLQYQMTSRLLKYSKQVRGGTWHIVLNCAGFSAIYLLKAQAPKRNPGECPQTFKENTKS